MMFCNRDDQAELVNLYHLARTGLADRPGVPSRLDRMQWAITAFVNARHASHVGIYRTRAYKALERALA